MWLNFKQWKMDDKKLISFLQKELRLGLNHGISFGPGGEQHMRLNFATPRKNLEVAIGKLQKGHVSLL